MKKLFYLLIAVAFLLFSCSSNKKEAEEKDSSELQLLTTAAKTEIDSTKPKVDENIPVVGADKDEHGCKLSAGYTWSILKKKCIRTWETGIKLNQAEKTNGAQFNAAIILSENKKQAELFINTETKSLILDKIEGSFPTAYKAKDYILTETPEGWTLSKGDKEIYNNF